jgi:hypothetical protein
VWRVIDEHARTLKLPGDDRAIGALRADAFVDLLVNAPDGPRVSYRVQALVPVDTLLGDGEADAHIPGHGPIPAPIARAIAEQAGQVQRLLVHPATGLLLDATTTRYPQAEWRGRLLRDPDTSARLDAHPDRYTPGDPLDRFIKLRDRHCRWARLPDTRRPLRPRPHHPPPPGRAHHPGQPGLLLPPSPPDQTPLDPGPGRARPADLHRSHRAHLPHPAAKPRRQRRSGRPALIRGVVCVFVPLGRDATYSPW